MSHRRAAHRATRGATVDTVSRPGKGGRRKGGRRKVVATSSRRPIPLSAAVGGVALLVAAVGAVSLSQPLPRAIAQPTATGPDVGVHVAAPANGEPHDSLYIRADPRASRGSARPAVVPSGALESAAEARVEARRAELVSAAVQSKSYAQDLARQARQVSRDWMLPTTAFHISTWFGEAGWYWSSGYHTGIDFATACGTPVVAVTGGTVTQAGWDGPYGYQVREQLPGGDEVWYNHLTLVETSVRAELAKGGVVGLVGETGNAYGCHLHLEYRLASDLKTAVDPAPFFADHGMTLH